ncbi:MAG: Imm42 family immunity protein [Alphaproteobacteria bacterium]
MTASLMIGDPKRFAIESYIKNAYEQPGLLAWGYFVIYLNGKCYGVRERDATLLACSFGAVEDRIACRGKHVVPFSSVPNPVEIADAYRRIEYTGEHDPEELFFGLSAKQFSSAVSKGKISWAPDGDEAFDDGSYVLQMDIGDRVRLIGFTSQESHKETLQSVSEYWMSAEEYYKILSEWRDRFLAEWAAAPKEMT